MSRRFLTAIHPDKGVFDLAAVTSITRAKIPRQDANKITTYDEHAILCFVGGQTITTSIPFADAAVAWTEYLLTPDTPPINPVLQILEKYLPAIETFIVKNLNLTVAPPAEAPDTASAPVTLQPPPN